MERLQETNLPGDEGEALRRRSKETVTSTHSRGGLCILPRCAAFIGLWCLAPCMEHRGGDLNGQAGARGAAGHLGKGDFQLNLRVKQINY